MNPEKNGELTEKDLASECVKDDALEEASGGAEFFGSPEEPGKFFQSEESGALLNPKEPGTFFKPEEPGNISNADESGVFFKPE